MSKRKTKESANTQTAGSAATHLEPKTVSKKSPLLDDEAKDIISGRLNVYSRNFEAERSRLNVLSDDASERNRIENAIQSAMKKLGLEEEFAEIRAVQAARRRRMEATREKTESDFSRGDTSGREGQ